MVMSMTGYGNEIFHLENDTVLHVEIRTVNSRYLDFKAHIPRSLYHLEIPMKKLIQSYIERGRVDLYITTIGSTLEDRSLHVDWALMDEYIEQIKEIQSRYRLSGEIPLSIITAIDELISINEETKRTEELDEFILKSIETVLEKVEETRRNEGVFLIEDIKRRISKIENTIRKIDGRRQIVYETYRERIRERIDSHFSEEQPYDESALMQEVALLAEKSDITEEITRIDSHLAHCEQVIQQTGSIGRKLDFIIQELHREVNTIGSKSVDPTISEWVVQIKSNLEKIKEQVQNIE